jgi:hypothetical protein
MSGGAGAENGLPNPSSSSSNPPLIALTPAMIPKMVGRKTTSATTSPTIPQPERLEPLSSVLLTTVTPDEPGAGG